MRQSSLFEFTNGGGGGGRGRGNGGGGGHKMTAAGAAAAARAASSGKKNGPSPAMAAAPKKMAEPKKVEAAVEVMSNRSPPRIPMPQILSSPLQEQAQAQQEAARVQTGKQEEEPNERKRSAMDPPAAAGSSAASSTTAYIVVTSSRSSSTASSLSTLSSSTSHTSEGVTYLDVAMKRLKRETSSSEEEQSASTTTKAAAPKVRKNIPELIPLSRSETDTICAKHNLQEIFSLFRFGRSSLYIAGGSVPEFRGDVAVNAANSGGVDGGGIDGVFNNLGGLEFQRFRWNLPVDADGRRIRTGKAVFTKAAGRLKSRYVVHAVGPNYCYSRSRDFSRENQLLESAYRDVVRVAMELRGVKTIGCCLLSAGVFAGGQNLDVIMKIGCGTLLDVLSTLAPTTSLTIFLIAFTEEEKRTLTRVSNDAYDDFLQSL